MKLPPTVPIHLQPDCKFTSIPSQQAEKVVQFYTGTGKWVSFCKGCTFFWEKQMLLSAQI